MTQGGGGHHPHGVLCRYFFQAMMVDEDAPPEAYSSAILLSPQPTLAELRRRFPFEGRHHFRLQQAPADGGNNYCWLDLTDPARVLPVGRHGEIRVKVLQLSTEPEAAADDDVGADDTIDVPEDRLYDAYFRARGRQPPRDREAAEAPGAGGVQDVGAVLSGVKKALASKMKQSVKMWEKVTGGASGGGGGGAPPTASSLAQLAKLVSAMKAPLSEGTREHVELLGRLWRGCFESQPFVPRGPPWGQLGFRQEDPLRELQCLLPLQCLVFFHEVHRQAALPMLNDQAVAPGGGGYGGDAYPYGLVASKVAYVLADILQLRDGACLGLERPFWRLFEDPIAFFELFSVVFRAFDESWKTNGHKSTDVGFHLEYAADFAQELLRRGPESVPALVDYAHQMQKW